MRFFFCLMVFFSHLDYLKNSSNKFLLSISRNIFYEGYIGVSFFFILSGFVLSYNYFDKFKFNKITSKDFYVARFSRIYPLHLLTLILSLPLLYFSILSKPFEYFLLSIIHVFLFQSFVPIEVVYFNFNSPSWSISDEMFFYLATPFLFSILSSFRSVYKLLLAVFVLCTILFLGMFFSPKGYHHAIFYVNPIVRLLDFTLGIFIFLIFRKIDTSRISNKLMSWLEFSSIMTFFFFFIYHNFIPQVYRFSIYYWFPIIFILFIFSFEKGAISKMLSNKLLIYLGEISFGFYMIHQLVIRFYTYIFKNLNYQDDYFFKTLIIFITTLILSILSFEFFEKKANLFIKGKLFKKI